MRPLFVLLVLSVAAMAADKPKVPAPELLTLERAEAIALRASPEIDGAYFRAKAAKASVQAVRSGLFPQITGQVSAVGTGNDILNAFGGDHIASHQTRLGNTGGLSNSTVFGRESNGVSITQLLSDFGRTTDLISASRFDALSAEHKSRIVRSQVILRVDEAYIQALGALSLQRVAVETESSRQLVFEQVSALKEGQLKSDLDVSVAKVGLEESKLLSLQARNAVERSQAELSSALGSRTLHIFRLSEESPPALPSGTVEGLIEQSLQRRPELLALRAERDAARKISAAERAARLPKISALGSVGRTPLGDPNVEGNYSAAGIIVEVPLFTGGRLSAHIEEAGDRANAAQKAVDEAENHVARDVREAWLDAQATLKKIDVAGDLYQSANEELLLAKSRYDLGVTSMIEFSQAQLIAAQAEIGAAAARYEYARARARLEFESGSLKYRTPAGAGR